MYCTSFFVTNQLFSSLFEYANMAHLISTIEMDYLNSFAFNNTVIKTPMLTLVSNNVLRVKKILSIISCLAVKAYTTKIHRVLNIMKTRKLTLWRNPGAPGQILCPHPKPKLKINKLPNQCNDLNRLFMSCCQLN